MQTHSKTLLCRYQYDPIDRLVDCKLSGQESARRFYQKDRLATEINSTVQHSIMQHDDHLLAQQQRQTGALETRLLATDQQRSVLSALNTTTPRPITYTPYGHRPLASGWLSLLGFNGERSDPVTGCYLLGNGYRAFNPVLMRFNSPDSWSPFGKGGLNAYAYCAGEPVNRDDRSGHMFSPIFAKKSPAASLLNTNTMKKVKYPLIDGEYKDWKKISYDIETFVDTYKKQPRLNFVAHGDQAPRFKSSRISNGQDSLDAQSLYDLSLNNGVNFNDYKNIRLIVCNSANGGSGSIAAALSKITHLPVKGYRGTVNFDKNLKSAIDYNVNTAGNIDARHNPPPYILTRNAVVKSLAYESIKFIRGYPSH